MFIIDILKRKAEALNGLFKTDFWTPRKIDYNYERAICIFDHQQFYELSYLYSVDKSIANFKPIQLNAFESNLDWHGLSERWSRNKRYMLVNYEQIYNIYGFTPWW